MIGLVLHTGEIAKIKFAEHTPNEGSNSGD